MSTEALPRRVISTSLGFPINSQMFLPVRSKRWFRPSRVSSTPPSPPSFVAGNAYTFCCFLYTFQATCIESYSVPRVLFSWRLTNPEPCPARFRRSGSSSWPSAGADAQVPHLGNLPQHAVGMHWLLHLLLIKMWPSPGRPMARIQSLELENLTLRHQLAVLQRTVKRPRVTAWDRALWVGLSRARAGWKEVCLLVKPSTVVGWHRSGFRLFWRIKSCRRGGRPVLESGLRHLVTQMSQENPLWGAPRIHGELLKLGFNASERSVARWMPRRPYDPQRAQTWKAFLDNHRELISAMDVLMVPTWNFRLLYVLVILDHGWRVIRQVSVTAHPPRNGCDSSFAMPSPMTTLPSCPTSCSTGTRSSGPRVPSWRHWASLRSRSGSGPLGRTGIASG